ncbi:MAG: hypothetical protein K8I00_13390, partial [Candidatus Omnitrophica bacterium]|nr:hypothetical protein [Candidatus Omnitrophota bacterium]
MKRLKRLCIYIFIGLLTGTVNAHAQGSPEYREAMMQATLALETREYPNALYYVKAAHFADRTQREPFELLKQIPPLDVNGRAFQLYYDSANKYYQQGDYRNARFFYQAAYYADFMAQDVREWLRHVDAVLAGRASPRPKPDIRWTTWESPPESGAIRVDVDPGKRVVTGRYTVEPDREVEAILKKYEDPEERRQRERQDKIEAALHDMARRQSQFSQTIKSQQLKQQAVTPLSVAGQQTPQYGKIYEEIFGEPPAPVNDDKKTVAAVEVSSEPPVRSPRPKKTVPHKREAQPRRSQPKDVIEVAQTIRLDEELWERQPGTILEIEFGKSLVLEGKRVQRFF